MTLPKLHSISKKILVALLGAFLLLFLLFHACANLCILRHDGGAWYSAFCHFMGSNYIVKVFEIILLGCILLHICLTVWLWICNQFARPVKYHQHSRTKTHTGSKLMIWTGILIFACLILHFTDFYFVKLGLGEGQYMVKTEALQSEELMAVQQASQQFGMEPEEFIQNYEEQLESYSGQMDPAEYMEAMDNLQGLKNAVPVLGFMSKVVAEGMLSEDGKWIKQINAEDKAMLETAFEDIDVEPDFYYMTRQKFGVPHIAILYLIFFVIVWLHLRHAFASAFQTFGLSNYKYAGAIEVLAQIYAWTICLIFAAVVILVFLGV